MFQGQTNRVQIKNSDQEAPPHDFPICSMCLNLNASTPGITW